ncbi:ABC transporter G family member 21-like [Amphibalanus amphitrite]|uniref:ABC transporter G family member 21-like n=1 Tax=Amphibalanus amphitrite TaxID=1232801 RepID=UPI001C909615|nr:ABC transporter G family member 21-like [Amphibalanus amphitrite]
MVVTSAVNIDTMPRLHPLEALRSFVGRDSSKEPAQGAALVTSTNTASILKRLPEPRRPEQHCAAANEPDSCRVHFADSSCPHPCRLPRRGRRERVVIDVEAERCASEREALVTGPAHVPRAAMTTQTSNGSEAGAQFSAVGKQRPVHLQFQNVGCSAGGRQILSGISGYVRPGEVLAVMGPSGSGKTSLLNVLSGRLKPDAGDVLLNGELLNKHLKRKICYVLQEDIFFAHLTLRQTLMYTAQLRLPDRLSHAEKVAHVDHIIDTLDLTRCQHTRIGEYMKGGLSGGEKKRANIGCELLTNPALMLLDEPSTGLDSSATYSLIKNLKEYALKERKTIVLTVHQPSSQVFYMFDKLLLLCNGQTAYFGEVGNVVNHFNSLGLFIQPHYNPADFVLEQLKTTEDKLQKILAAARPNSKSQLSADTPFSSTGSLYSAPYTGGDASEPSEKDVPKCKCGQKLPWPSTINEQEELPKICKNCRNSSATDLSILIETARPGLDLEAATDQDSGTSTWSNDSHSNELEEEFFTDRWPTSFWTQFKVLTLRNFREARPRVLSRLNLILTVALALLAGLVWFQLERTEESIADFQGWIFFSTNYWMLFSLFGALFNFPSQQQVVNKERASGAYRLSAFYLSRVFGELPLLMVPPTLYFVISYPMMAGSSAVTFIQLLLLLLLNSIVAESVGVFFGVACMDFQVGNTVGAIFTCGTQLFGGFLSTHIPSWLGWMRYLSMVFYAYQNMQIVEFTNGAPFRCAEENSKFVACVADGATFVPPEELLSRRGGELPFWANLSALFAFMVVFRVLGYVVLRFFRTPTH